MRRILISLILLVLTSVVGFAQTGAPNSDEVLIVYLSRTNNTKVMAEFIHSYVGGTLVNLELKTPYPENYGEIVAQVARENETGFLPPLRTEIKDIARYDMIFIGFPTWGMQLPPPIKSFLRQYDLSGKVVVPFNSNGGYGVGSSFQTVKELCPESRIVEGFTSRGGNERDGILLALKYERGEKVREEIKRWLQRSGLLK